MFVVWCGEQAFNFETADVFVPVAGEPVIEGADALQADFGFSNAEHEELPEAVRFQEIFEERSLGEYKHDNYNKTGKQNFRETGQRNPL